MMTESVRQLVLDTETTGLSPEEGHRVVEIGIVELVNRHPTGNTFHHYLHPDRQIPEESTRIHGITDERVAGCPRFWQVADDFLAFIGDSPLVIHNAAFDMAFINHELRLAERDTLERHPVVDTLTEARRRHPRQRNSLDALCKRYGVDNSQRTVHGALLDAEILADVYVAMLGGHQIVLGELEHCWGGVETAREQEVGKESGLPGVGTDPHAGGVLPADGVLPEGRHGILARASPQELEAHATILARLGDTRIWRDELQ